MKRVKAACIFQTLIFSQKEELGLSAEEELRANRAEVAHYKETLEANKTKYQITQERERADGSIVIHVRKQYNDKIDPTEYFA
ncbi:MAG: hypothetical protein E7590_03435 [Ruminococcaceae bacterium]|nr:hypothetical protein [Oscillospiraceae bacterium]